MDSIRQRSRYRHDYQDDDASSGSPAAVKRSFKSSKKPPHATEQRLVAIESMLDKLNQTIQPPINIKKPKKIYDSDISSVNDRVKLE